MVLRADVGLQGGLPVHNIDQTYQKDLGHDKVFPCIVCAGGAVRQI